MQRISAAVAAILAAIIMITGPARAAAVIQPSSQAMKSETHDRTPSVATNEPLLPRHDRLFIAVFDCSWKHASKGPSEPTTANRIYRELQQAGPTTEGIHAGYVQTDCARTNWYASGDRGEQLVAERLAAMYRQLASQAMHWWREDPTVQINLLSVGGSWGALQAAEFVDMVDALGVRTPDGTPLVGPHRTVQALALLDPVGTAPEELYLPSSLVSAFQLTATDERRPDFQTLPILPAGLSHHNRYANLPVPGSLSDVCGGYRLDGLSIRAANLLVDYINGLSHTPLLKKRREPDDPRLNVVHRSEEEGT